MGLHLTFSGAGWGVGTFEGDWAIERSEHSKWTEESRRQRIFDAVWRLKDTLVKAKKQHVAELVGTPVEVTLDGNLLKSWRVLTEVLP